LLVARPKRQNFRPQRGGCQTKKQRVGNPGEKQCLPLEDRSKGQHRAKKHDTESEQGSLRRAKKKKWARGRGTEIQGAGRNWGGRFSERGMKKYKWGGVLR